MEEAGDSLDDGEAPEDTIDKDDKLKCSEINLELLQTLTKVEFCRAVWHSATYHFSFCTKSKSRAALLQRRLLAMSPSP